MDHIKQKALECNTKVEQAFECHHRELYTLELELLELREKKLTGSTKLGDIAVPKVEHA